MKCCILSILLLLSIISTSESRGFFRFHFIPNRDVLVKISINNGNSVDIPLTGKKQQDWIVPINVKEDEFTYEIVMIDPRRNADLRTIKRVPKTELNTHGKSFPARFITEMETVLEMTTVLTCATDYYGRTCNVKCQAPFANTFCNEKGRIQCEDGLEGNKCDQVVKNKTCECSSGGSCVALPNVNDGKLTCDCLYGFYGPKCENEIVVPDSWETEEREMREFMKRNPIIWH